MLEIISGLPAHVLGVKAAGEVDADDIKDVLSPSLKMQVEEYEELNYLLVLDTSVGNFTAGAWLKDIKAGLQNFTKWNRIAVVTEQAAVEKFTDLFSLAVPGKSKGFTHAELEEAKKWVSAKDQH